MTQYTYYQDPGHGWLKVTISEIERLMIEVSSYSYVRGDHAFLEEDCDMSKFLAAKAELGEKMKIRRMNK